MRPSIEAAMLGMAAASGIPVVLLLTDWLPAEQGRW